MAIVVTRPTLNQTTNGADTRSMLAESGQGAERPYVWEAKNRRT
jgi:hypothetical protein